MDIAVIGSNMVDLITYTNQMPKEGETLEAPAFKIGCGGKGANQAVAAAKLNSKVLMLTKVGDDIFADNTIRNLESWGINTTYVEKVPCTSSGVAPIFVNANSSNSILIIKGANKFLSPEDIDRAAEDLKKCQLIVLQLEVQLETVYHAIEFGKKHGIEVLLNPAPALRELDMSYACKCDFFVPNETELEILTGNKTPLFQFILLSCLFPLWGCAAALNDILITQFKSVFSLSNFASALVQSAFYGGYFLIAIPASLVIKKTSYKVAILIGLTLYIVGCTLFFPASHMATYTMFLAAIFAIAIGLSFLETAANTYSSMIGPKAYATLRLNISQTFYPIGAAAGILLGKYLVFSEGESLEKQMAGMNAEQVHNFKVLMLENTLEPYKYMIMVLVVVMVLFLLTRFPTCKVAQTASHKRPSALDTLRYLASNARFRRGIVAQFLYVGMQVAVWSFTIRLALELGDINERDASTFMVYSFACFFIGKFIANILMTRFNPEKVLILYSVIGALFLAYVALAPSFSAVYVAVLVSVLFGPCWATIYAGTLDTVDNEHTEMAGAVIVMAIVGAAVVPAIQGYVADMFHSLQLSFLVSMLCFVYVGVYFWRESKVRGNLAEVAAS
ncbi:L-fucose:H+ symporter permease [Salmonella enterica subsp. enterica serovar Javiana]|nr:L-fucose:H+ symporter permease [Salmonella enterica subsp. enterica serovar Javiana]ECB7271077.1 L-fucose:H+ symporter permease [Salmonella enterica subsp. enterica serovar Javiana]